MHIVVIISLSWKRIKFVVVFYCKQIFSPLEIDDWIVEDTKIDYRGTALCPYCGIDSVIGASSGFPITKEFLEAMYRTWFG